jgi:malonate transporter
MLATFGALAPVFLMIGLGRVLAARGFPGDGFWPAAERLVYWILLPALLLVTTAGSDLTGLNAPPLVAGLIAAIFLTAGLALALRSWLALSDPAFSSVFQGAMRTNTYVGLAGAGTLYGEAGLALMGVVVLVVITTVNVLSVIALTRLGGRRAGRSALVAVAQNPLIVACLAGFTIEAIGLAPLLELVRPTLEILARSSLTLGLLCVGAGLDLSRLTAQGRALGATCGLKLLVMPAATALFCHLLGVEGLTAAVAILFNSVPISASSYVLARQLGGDARLMASLIATTTLAAVVTMPLVLALLT